MEIQHEENHHAGCFFFEADGERIGEMHYHIYDDRMKIIHTEVSPRLNGRGMGFNLVEAGVRYGRENNLKIVPACAFARAVIDRTPAFRQLVAEQE